MQFAAVFCIALMTAATWWTWNLAAPLLGAGGRAAHKAWLDLLAVAMLALVMLVKRGPSSGSWTY